MQSQIRFLCILMLVYSGASAQKLDSTQYYRGITANEYSYIPENNWCSSDICLFSDSSFQDVTGCENHQYLMMGTWSRHSNGTLLKSLPRDSVQAICHIDAKGTGPARNERVTIYVYDKLGKPVPNLYIVPLNYLYSFPVGGATYVQVIDTIPALNGKPTWEAFLTNSSGAVTIPRQYDSISIPVLENLFQQKYRFLVRSLPDTLIISLAVADKYEIFSTIYSDKVYQSTTQLIPVEYDTRSLTWGKIIFKRVK